MKARKLASFAVLVMAASVIAAPTASLAAPGDLFIQVDLSVVDPNSPNVSGCSILRVTPSGTLSEFVSNAAILAVTGESEADCDDTGMAIARDGTLYFAEDISHDILRVTPAGVVSVFVDATTIDAVIGETSDIDNGLIFGLDGNLYAADQECDCILRITVPGGVVSIVVSEAAIEAVAGTNADLEGGIGHDAAGNFYITVDDDDDPDTGAVLKVTSGGTVSILASRAAIMAATGTTDVDLDTGAVLGSSFFVNDDGGEDEDKIFAVNPSTGAVTLIASGAAINAVTGNPNADLEGGIDIDGAGVLFVGDDGDDDGADDRANILRVTQAGAVSIFVSDTQISGFYGGLYSLGSARLRGSLVIEDAVQAQAAPALSAVAAAATLLLLGGFGLSRRKRH